MATYQRVVAYKSKHAVLLSCVFLFVFGIALLRLNELAEIIEGQMLLVPALSLQKLDSLIFNISHNYLFDKKVTTFLCQLD